MTDARSTEFEKHFREAIKRAYNEGCLSPDELAKLDQAITSKDAAVGRLFLRRLIHLEETALNTLNQAPHESRPNPTLADPGLDVKVAKLLGLLAEIDPRLVQPAQEPADLLDDSEALEGIQLLSPNGEEPLYPYTFSWRAVPDAAWYRVEIIKESGEVLYSTKTNKVELVWPVAVWRPVAKETFRWRVSTEVGGRQFSNETTVTPFEVVYSETPALLTAPEPRSILNGRSLWSRLATAFELRTWRSPRAWRAWLAVAATAGIALLLSISDPTDNRSQLRTGTSDAGERTTVGCVLTAPVGVISDRRPTFTWSGVEGANSTLTLYSSQFDEIWSLTTEGNEVGYPALYAALGLGKYYWKLEWTRGAQTGMETAGFEIVQR